MTRDLLLVSTYALILAHSENESISTQRRFSAVTCAESGTRNYALLRNLTITKKDVRLFHHTLPSTLIHFPQAKYNSTFHVRLVANKLSEIVGSLRNST